MGGPYIPIEMVQKALTKLIKGSRPFFGKIEIECENGEVYRIMKHETLKRSEVERLLTS